MDNANGKAVALDGVGNVFVFGFISGTASFNSVTMNGAGSVFVAKYDSFGNVSWATKGDTGGTT